VDELRLGTFNALSGRSLTRPDADPELLAAAVKALEPDVLALQEVDRHQDRSGGSDQARLVADALGVDPRDGYRFVATLHGTPGLPGWVPAIGTGPGPARSGADQPTDLPSYGIALVSRVPVRHWLMLGLGGTPGRYPLVVPGTRPRVRWLKDEPRAAIAAVLDRPRMTVACAHLSFVPGRNAVQLRRVVTWLRTLPGPHILLGDLNLPGSLPARLTGWTPLLDAPTYPSPMPKLQLDHVLAHGLPERTQHSGSVIRLPVSDHCAAVVTLTLP
jgi:endonuclease/exonuclease/phosphatase family metal-dependent hydrolase